LYSRGNEDPHPTITRLLFDIREKVMHEEVSGIAAPVARLKHNPRNILDIG
jgi:hypothetical protein